MAAPKGFDIPASVRGTHAQSMSDMYHDPNLVLLMMEYVEDSFAHGATHVELSLVQSEDGGDFHATYLDDGDGLADGSRIQNPSSEAGTGTSVYGQGHRMARIRADHDRSNFKFLIAFKPAGKLTAKGFKGPWTKDGLTPWDCGINEPECPWDSVDDHGYYEEFRIASDSFPKACADKAKACDVFRADIKELMCVRFPQRMFDEMSFTIRTWDSTGPMSMQVTKSTPDAPWKTFVSVLESSPQVNRYNPIETVIDTCALTLTFYCVNNTDENLASFTNYGRATKMNAAAGILMMCLGDRVIQIKPLSDVYGAGKHGNHQRRIVVAQMTPVGGDVKTWDLTKTPVPTTIKTDFVPSPLLSSIHGFIKANKPAGFLAGSKKALPAQPALPVDPQPIDPEAAVTINDEDLPVNFTKTIGSGTLSICIRNGINTLVFEKDRLAANSEYSIVSCVAFTALKLCKDRGWNRVNIEMKVAASRAAGVNSAIAVLRDSGMRIASNISVV